MALKVGQSLSRPVTGTHRIDEVDGRETSTRTSSHTGPQVPATMIGTGQAPQLEPIQSADQDAMVDGIATEGPADDYYKSSFALQVPNQGKAYMEEITWFSKTSHIQENNRYDPNSRINGLGGDPVAKCRALLLGTKKV